MTISNPPGILQQLLERPGPSSFSRHDPTRTNTPPQPLPFPGLTKLLRNPDRLSQVPQSKIIDALIRKSLARQKKMGFSDYLVVEEKSKHGLAHEEFDERGVVKKRRRMSHEMSECGEGCVEGSQRIRGILSSLPRLVVEGLGKGDGDRPRVWREIDWNRREQFWRQIRGSSRKIPDATNQEVRREVEEYVKEEVSEEGKNEKVEANTQTESSSISKFVRPGSWVSDHTPKIEIRKTEETIELENAEVTPKIEAKQPEQILKIESANITTIQPICSGAWATGDSTPEQAFVTAPLNPVEDLPTYESLAEEENPIIQELRKSESQARLRREEKIREQQLLIRTEKKSPGSKKEESKVILDLSLKGVQEHHWKRNAIEHAEDVAALAAVSPRALIDTRKEFPFPDSVLDVGVGEDIEIGHVNSESDADAVLPSHEFAKSVLIHEVTELDNKYLKINWKVLGERLQREAAEAEKFARAGDDAKKSGTCSRRNSPLSVNTTGPTTPVPGINLFRSAQKSIYQATPPESPFIIVPGQEKIEQVNFKPEQPSQDPYHLPTIPTKSKDRFKPSTELATNLSSADGAKSSQGCNILASSSSKRPVSYISHHGSSSGTRRSVPKTPILQLREAQAALRAVIIDSFPETSAAPSEKTKPSSPPHPSFFPPTTSGLDKKAKGNPSLLSVHKRENVKNASFSSNRPGHDDSIEIEMEEPSATQYKKMSAGRRKLGSTMLRQLTEASLELNLKMGNQDVSRRDQVMANRKSMTTFRKVDFLGKFGGKSKKRDEEKNIELRRHYSSPIPEGFENGTSPDDYAAPNSPSPYPHKSRNSVNSSSISPRTRSTEVITPNVPVEAQELSGPIEIDDGFPLSYTSNPEILSTQKLSEQEAPFTIPVRNPRRRIEPQHEQPESGILTVARIQKKASTNSGLSQQSEDDTDTDDYSFYDEEALERSLSEAEWLANTRFGTAETVRVERPQSGITLVHVSGSGSSKRSSLPGLESSQSREGSGSRCSNSTSSTKSSLQQAWMKPSNRTPPSPPPFSSATSFTRTCAPINMDDDAAATPPLSTSTLPLPIQSNQRHIPIKVPKHIPIVIENPNNPSYALTAGNASYNAKYHKRVDSKVFSDASTPLDFRKSIASTVISCTRADDNESNSRISLRNVLQKKRPQSQGNGLETARRGSLARPMTGTKANLGNQRMDEGMTFKKGDVDQMSVVSMMSGRTWKVKRDKVKRFFGRKVKN